MKGVTEVEFIISVFVFITTMSFVTLLIINSIPLFHTTALSDSLKARSYQYSELLLFDEGHPKDWNKDTANRIGLSSGKRYFVSKTKVDELGALCALPNGYNTLKNKLQLSNELDIIIEVSYLDDMPVSGSSTIICKPPVTTYLRPQFRTARLGVLSDNSIVHFKVIVIG